LVNEKTGRPLLYDQRPAYFILSDAKEPVLDDETGSFLLIIHL
jgi:hypothetical protein